MLVLIEKQAKYPGLLLKDACFSALVLFFCIDVWIEWILRDAVIQDRELMLP